VANREQAASLELRTIQRIAIHGRHGTARDLFTVWFGTNLNLLTIVTGALAVSVFNLSFAWAVLALTAGNFVGTVFMALHAAQGPRLGVPQMVQTRGQFGSYGSLLVVGIVIVMYVGFLASNLVVGGQAVASAVTGSTESLGIWALGIVGVIATIYGHDLIHAYTRVLTYAAGVVLIVTLVWVVWVHGMPADFLSRNGFNPKGFLGAVSVSALWDLAYAPYVSDYSRYMPHDTGSNPAFWASYWGCALGSLLPMILGVIIALAAPAGDLTNQLVALTPGIGPFVLLVFAIGIAASNAMNLYCGALSALTFGQTLFPALSPGPRSRTVTTLILFALSICCAFLNKGSFLSSYQAFILLLLYLLVPWTAINLVDYYLLRHGEYDVAAFFRQDGGIYGFVNAPAVICYVLGILVQVPFVSNQLYTGPVARALGGADLSWIVGLLISSSAYYWLAKSSPAYRSALLVKPSTGSSKMGTANR
jgi:nucleobase:cation symporter-1, NCS1 family